MDQFGRFQRKKIRKRHRIPCSHATGNLAYLVLVTWYIGIFCAYMLNHVRLAPGEANFLGTGECIECTANSDNVIRAGLTLNLGDLPNLISRLTYAAALPSKHVRDVVEPKLFSAFSTLHDPPIAEFSVIQTKLQQHNVDVQKTVAGPSIGIVNNGKGSLQWATTMFLAWVVETFSLWVLIQK